MSVANYPAPEIFPFDSLPDELNLRVFSYLEIPDVASCSRVCIKWLHFCNRGIVWKGLSLGNLDFLQPENIKQFLSRHAITSEKKLLTTIRTFLHDTPKGVRSRLTVNYPFDDYSQLHIEYGYHVRNCGATHPENEKLYYLTKDLGRSMPMTHIFSGSLHDHGYTHVTVRSYTFRSQNPCYISEIQNNLPLSQLQSNKIKRMIKKKHTRDKTRSVALQTLCAVVTGGILFSLLAMPVLI